MQRVRAARVGPNIGEGYLARSALLKEHLVRGGVKEEHAEGSVEDSSGLGGGELVRGVFGFGADDGVGG